MGDGAYGPGLTAGIMVFGPPPRAHIGPAPPRAHEDRVLVNGLHRPGPPTGTGAAACGSQTPLGLSIRAGLGGPDLPFPGKGSGATTCCLKLPRRRLQGQPCHVPVAEGLLWSASPATALNTGRWAARA
jgi:hypothetical protein